MASGDTAGELRFEPPGPGPWELDPVHFPRPVTRYWEETQPDPFERGFRATSRYYGMLVDTMQFRYVNGFAYRTSTPLADDEIPGSFRRAEEVFEHKLWREQLREWDETFKPASIAAHRELQSVDPDSLSNTELVGYLTRCRDHHAEMIYQHRRFTGAAMIPTGDLLAHVGDWTALPYAELLEMMRGAAPVSAGASAELERLIDNIRQDPAAQKLLESEDDAGQVLGSLRALDGDAGSAMSDYLDVTGYRLLDGFDISECYALELPDVLLRAVRVSVQGRRADDSDVEDQIADIRAQVPEQHRAQFDELLGEARLTYRIRDERGVFSDIWAAGIMRRGVLAGGRRLAGQGRIDDPEHLIDAGFEEMCSLLSGAGGPSADELAGRFQYRMSHSAKEAPAHLGPPSPPHPEASGLPPAAARIMRATAISTEALFGSSTASHEERLLRGLAASGGTYQGPARRVSGRDEFSRILPGDVLVTESTTEAFNILLPLLGAVVTDSGGLLSHAALVAREYGIPGVVGTRDGTERIPDGAIVRVDGDAGEVTLIG